MSELAEVSSVAEISDDETLLRVAFATRNGERVNQHFGSSQGFEIYGIRADETQHIASKSFNKEKQDGNEDKLKPKLAFLHGCDLVYVGSIGGSATKQLIMLGINPVVVNGAPAIDEIVKELQQELSDGMSPMLQRVMKQKTGKSENRFDDMEDEGWDE
ncbi:MAG: NifB/NifX family molybdenum-iron cluster-binding protein [Gammaproteobacteria bacterium]